MKNKYGFTLIELLAVIAIIAIIAVIATPNIVNMVDNGKKNSFISDGKTMISLAIYKNKLEKYQDLFTTLDNCKIISAKNAGFEETKDPDGNTYNLDSSKIKICQVTENNVTSLKYYVKTISLGAKARGIKGETTDDYYVLEENLTNKYVKELETNIQ